MDQVTMTDNHYVTREFLETQLVANKERIAQLEDSHTKLARRDMATAAELNALREGLQEWTFNELENGGITEEQAEELATVGCFELTKEFELEVSVQYSITVNARDEESAQNLIHDIDFDSVSEPQGVTYLSSSVDRIDI